MSLPYENSSSGSGAVITERPILFSAPMVRALLDGSKTQTRRVVKPQPERCELGGFITTDKQGRRWAHGLGSNEAGTRRNFLYRCPYGKPGDRLWVRETYADAGCRLTYRADADDGAHCQVKKWTPAIHMFRADSRILLEIISVRVERLQDISEADADAEGCERLDSEREVADWALCDRCGGTRLHRALGPNGGVIEDVDCVECDTYVKRYKHLSESINGAGSWDANPWVWVVEFKRVTP